MDSEFDHRMDEHPRNRPTSLSWVGFVVVSLALLITVFLGLTLATQQARHNDLMIKRSISRLLSDLGQHTNRDIPQLLTFTFGDMLTVTEWGVYASPAHCLSDPLSSSPLEMSFLLRDDEVKVHRLSTRGSSLVEGVYEISVVWREGRALVAKRDKTSPSARLILRIISPGPLRLLNKIWKRSGWLILIQALILGGFTLLMLRKILVIPLRTISHLGTQLSRSSLPIEPPLEEAATELIDLQSALLTLHRELRHEQHQLSAAHLALSAQERQVMMSFISSQVMHELGNPLASVSGLLEFLHTDEQTSSAQRQLLDLAMGELRRMREITRRWSEFTTPHMSDDHRTEVSNLITWIRFMFRYHDRYSAIELKVSGPETLTLSVGHNAMKHAVLNLALNAARAQGGQGLIWIDIKDQSDRSTSYEASGGIRFTISDQGPGIPRHLADKIFEVGVSDSQDGRGLGLSIAKTVLEQQGASLDLIALKASDDPNLDLAEEFPGARFTIWIPSGDTIYSSGQSTV